MKAFSKSIFLVLIAAGNFAVAEAAAPASPVSAIGPMVPLLIIFGIFYFLIIRPQQKKAKEQQKFIAELKRGDMVITNSGIIGMVKTLSDKLITLEVDEGVCLKVLRSQILEGASALTKEPKPA